MVKVIGLPELAERIEADERMRKAKKAIERDRVKMMVAEGVDPEIAKVMVKSLVACGL